LNNNLNISQKSGLSKKGSVHNLRNSFATQLIESGTKVRYIQELPGHSSIKTTMICTHVTNKTINWFQSPLDRLNLTTESKNDKKMTKKYNNFGIVTGCLQAYCDTLLLRFRQSTLLHKPLS